MADRVQNQLAAVRKSRGTTAAELAKRIGVSRQTIYAIEAGTYIPNTEVALRLARELEVGLEELFSLQDDKEPVAEQIQAEILSAQPHLKGQPVRICRTGPNWLSVPVTAAPYWLPEADGVISGKTELTVLATEEAFSKRLILAGCDPASSLLARIVEKITGIEVLCAPAASRLALQWLEQGKVQIAGSHLDEPVVKEEFTAVNFATWETGIITAPGNPKKIRSLEDLARPGLRFINREEGSGSRALLIRLLKASGIPPKHINGFSQTAFGHLAAAYAVLSGQADACFAIRSAARTFGLEFIPLQSERYDLVMRRDTLDLPAAQAFLDVLHRASLRRKLEVLAGYDTSQTGNILSA
jgi:molybdate-binding protein/DNA-binding XRE family transcriptional regulator